MPAHPPLVVAILHSDEDDIDYQLYSEAYGIEMQVDDEWEAEAILLAPHGHIAAVTENTDVTGEDAAIVSAGVTDIPISVAGKFDLTAISDPQNNWLLVGDPRLNDTDETISNKLLAALSSNCRVIVCITEVTAEHIATRLNGIGSIDASRIVIALIHPDATNVATAAAKTARDQLNSSGVTGDPRFIVAGDVTGENAGNVLAIDGVDGVLLVDDKYDEFGTILEVLEALGD